MVQHPIHGGVNTPSRFVLLKPRDKVWPDGPFGSQNIIYSIIPKHYADFTFLPLLIVALHLVAAVAVFTISPQWAMKWENRFVVIKILFNIR